MMSISTENHLRVASFHIIGTCIMLICLWWLQFNKDAVLVFFVIWIIYTLPAFYLHMEYYLYNRGESYEISGNELIQYRDGQTRRYNSSDIISMTVYIAPNAYLPNSFQLLAIESYYYTRILMKNGEEIIITCLMAGKLKDELKRLNGVHYEVRKRLFNSINW